MLCQHLFLASCICILRYPLIWLPPSPTCRLSLPIPAALRYPEPAAGRAGQLWPSSYSAEEDNTTRVLLTSKCLFPGFPLESLAAPTWTRKTRLVKHNGIRRGRGRVDSRRKWKQARGGSLLWGARYVAPMMHPFVLNNNYKATVFSLSEFYPRFNLPLFLPQSRGLPSVSPHHYVIAPDFNSSVRVLFTHIVLTPCKYVRSNFSRTPF